MITGRKPSAESLALRSSNRDYPDPANAGGNLTHLDPPEDLHPLARQVWELVVPDLLATGVLRESDTLLLTEFCEQVRLALEARERIDFWTAELERVSKEGPEMFDKRMEYHEVVRELSLAVKRERTSYVEMMKLAMSTAAEHGLSPVARIRLGIGRLQGASLLDALNKAREGSDAGSS